MRPQSFSRSGLLGPAPARAMRPQNRSLNADRPGSSSPSASSTSSSNPDPSSSSSPEQPQQQQQQQYRYVDAAGKRKATLQDAAPSLTSSSSDEQTRPPWELGFQLPERSSALWGDDLRRRLIRHALASQFGESNAQAPGALVLSEEEIEERLAQLARLLPGLAPRLATTSASLLAGMVADPAAVAATLVGLRATFPGADVGRMVARSPQLALAGGNSGGNGSGSGNNNNNNNRSGLAALAEARAALAQLLPNLDVDAAVSEHPSLLDVEGVASAIEEARRVLECKFELGAFEREPSLVFRFQHGDLLIPYDQFEKGS